MARARRKGSPTWLGGATTDMLCGRRGKGAAMSNAESLRKGLALAFAAVICFCLVYANARADEASAQLAREHLYVGTLGAGAVALAAKVGADGGDHEARFGLGLISFARAV